MRPPGHSSANSAGVASKESASSKRRSSSGYEPVWARTRAPWTCRASTSRSTTGWRSSGVRPPRKRPKRRPERSPPPSRASARSATSSPLASQLFVGPCSARQTGAPATLGGGCLYFSDSCSTADEIEQFVALAFHGLAVAGFHVEAQERFGVRRAKVEPPVPVVYGDAVEVVYLGVVALRVVLLHLLERRLLILDLAVDLAGADVGVYGGEQLGERALLARDELGDGQHGDYPRVGEVVVPEVEVPGVLAAEGGVVLAHLRLDDGVAGLGPDGPTALALDELGEGLGADRAVEDGGPGLLLEDVLGDERGEQISGDSLTLLVHDEDPVGVPVEGGPEVRVLGHDPLLQLLHVLRLDRVRRVVREGAVELEVHRDVLERQLLEDGGEHLAGHAVAGVHDDLERTEAIGVYEGQAVFGVILGDVARFDGAGVLGGFGQLAGDDEVPDLPDAVLARECDGVLPAQLEAVVLLGVVGSRDHRSTRLFEVPDGEVQRVGRDETHIQDVRAGLGNTLYESFLEGLPGEPHVAGDDDPGAGETQVVDEGAADVPGRVLVQVVGIHAPDVVGLEYRLVDHPLLPPDSSWSPRNRSLRIRYNNFLWILVQITRAKPSICRKHAKLWPRSAGIASGSVQDRAYELARTSFSTHFGAVNRRRSGSQLDRPCGAENLSSTVFGMHDDIGLGSAHQHGCLESVPGERS